MNKQIICRHAEDDFYALVIAQAMENAGCTVISIAHDGMHQRQGAMIPCSKFIVFANYGASTTPDEIDDVIAFEFKQNNL